MIHEPICICMKCTLDRSGTKMTVKEAKLLLETIGKKNIEREHEQWLSERMELVFGKRCTDLSVECHVCNAWTLFDYLVNKGEME